MTLNCGICGDEVEVKDGYCTCPSCMLDVTRYRVLNKEFNDRVNEAFHHAIESMTQSILDCCELLDGHRPEGCEIPTSKATEVIRTALNRKANIRA